MAEQPAPMPAEPSESTPVIVERKSAPEGHKEKARAMYYQGKPRQAIAEQLGIKPATVDSWRVRGKWMIRDRSTVQGDNQGQPNPAIALLKAHPAEADVLRPITREYLKSIHPQLPKRLPKEPRAFKDLMTGISAFVTSCKLVEGWSDTSIAVLDLEQLGRDHREIVVTPVTPATSGGQLPSDYQQSPESLGNSG